MESREKVLVFRMDMVGPAIGHTVQVVEGRASWVVRRDIGADANGGVKVTTYWAEGPWPEEAP